MDQISGKYPVCGTSGWFQDIWSTVLYLNCSHQISGSIHPRFFMYYKFVPLWIVGKLKYSVFYSYWLKMWRHIERVESGLYVNISSCTTSHIRVMSHAVCKKNKILEWRRGPTSHPDWWVQVKKLTLERNLSLMGLSQTRK